MQPKYSRFLERENIVMQPTSAATCTRRSLPLAGLAAGKKSYKRADSDSPAVRGHPTS